MAERKRSSTGSWRWLIVVGVIVLGAWAMFLGRRLTDQMNTVPDHARTLLDRAGPTREALRCPVAGGTDGLPETVTVGLTRAAGEGVTQTRRARGTFRDGVLVLTGVGETGSGRLYVEARGVGSFSWSDGTCDTVTFIPVDDAPPPGAP